MRTSEQLQALRHVPMARNVHVHGDHSDLTPLLALKAPDWLYLRDNDVLTDLSVLSSLPRFSELSLDRCSAVRDLTALVTCGLTELHLYDVHHDISLEPLGEMPELQRVLFSYPLLMESVGELPMGPQLTDLYLYRQASYLNLDGIERWPKLKSLALSGAAQIRQLARIPSLSGLTTLSLLHQSPLDLADISHLTGLRQLYLRQCELPTGLGPVRDLPALTAISLDSCAQSGIPLDLSTLADLEGLTVNLIGNDTPVTGEDLFPPGRIVRAE
ncbi:hypothetical protein [Streptomyces sp. NPDC056672]|uniref:hypothetical protein n=1 Tax=Streptomyces sp. NPDC056672 TaxID=3345906 RepID=UPI0036BC5E44